MDISVLLGGFGGQGVQTIGKLLTYGANEAEKYVTFYPAYGGTQRGGTSNCTVIVSDDEIASPSRYMVDYVIALNIPSYQAFSKRVVPGGTLVVNSSVVKDIAPREDIRIVRIPANEMAEEIGSPKVLNVVMLGFFAELSGFVPVDVMKRIALEKLAKKKEYAEMNSRAFDYGVAYAKGQK